MNEKLEMRDVAWAMLLAENTSLNVPDEIKTVLRKLPSLLARMEFMSLAMEEMQKREGELSKMLEKCRRQFNQQAILHGQKNTADGNVKARRNEALRDEIAALLYGHLNESAK